MADREEDLAAGNRSTAILFGSADIFMVALLQGLFLLTMLATRESGSPYLPAYYSGLAIALGAGRQSDLASPQPGPEGLLLGFQR